MGYKNSRKKYIYMVLIFISTFFMGLGYASINDISLNISGLAVAAPQEGIFITDVSYLESNKADLENTEIISIYQNNLNSKVVLENDENATITYQVIIHNSADYAYQFDGIEYIVGEETYSNENIIFELNGLEIGDVVVSNDDIEFTISFKYKEKPITDCELVSLLNFKFSLAPYVVATYEYTGDYETFVAPRDGIYKIELWGAGGEVYELVHSETVGNGAYVSGELFLEKDFNLFVYVGDVENFNGGGLGEAGGGGGVIKEWNGFKYTYEGDSPGHGGGLNGYDANYNITNATVPGFGYSGYGATQINGGLPGKPSGYYELNPETKGGFGYGGYANAYVAGITVYNHSSGGGSGYYGGGHGVHTNNAWTGGGGGSSFISGHDGCDAILESSTENNIVHTGQSIHYTGYKFVNTVMIDGAGYNWTTEKGEYTGMPSHDGTSLITGNKGNGYAVITFISELND